MTTPSIPIRKDTAPARSLHDGTPICVPCQRNYRCERNGILVRLGPDAIISTDMYQCPGCGHQVLKGFAPRAVERYGGPYRDLFEAQDRAMGDAAITDREGEPTCGNPVRCPDCENARQSGGNPPPHDCSLYIPAEDAAEAAASQERWR